MTMLRMMVVQVAAIDGRMEEEEEDWQGAL
jgi:hypothetical protein